MPDIFQPTGRQAVIQTMIDLLGLDVAEGTAADVADFLDTLLPEATTPATLVPDISQLLVALIVGYRLTDQRLGVLETDATTLG